MAEEVRKKDTRKKSIITLSLG